METAASNDDETTCPNCGEGAPPDATWCEACGQELAAEPLPECVSCGEREVGPDGYCGSCGWKQPEERDHLEFRDGDVAAVTDRGKRHRHNEDSVAVGSGRDGSAIMVVCDGVSSTPGSAEASLRAAVAARDLLVVGVGDELVDLETLLVKAAEAAQAEASLSTELASNAPHVQGGPPSSTFVAVVAAPSEEGVTVATAWVGDSRAYWCGPDPQCLTDDHEIAGSLVRWLGADSLDPTPEVRITTHGGTGHLVVCSDGLWRYAAEPDEMRALVDGLVEGGRRGPTLASALVEHANASGGHDNISVAVWTNDPTLRAAPEPGRGPGPDVGPHDGSPDGASTAEWPAPAVDEPEPPGPPADPAPGTTDETS